jgi:hypothetical protein
LALGKALVLEFVAERLPAEAGRVQAFFRRRGAYSKIKELLDKKGLLDEWYIYEDTQQKAALREWCRENSIEITD